jgi:hypothetical protein
MRKSGLVLVLFALFLPRTAVAWNNGGHMTVAAVAYMSLSAPTKARVDALLRQHPDFSTLAQGLSADSSDFGLFVFMRAATWPDQIRDDPRFFDDTDPKAVETPLLDGFPDMKVHRPWHFIDEPFSTDGSETTSPEEPNALTQIVAFEHALGDANVTAATQAYDLPWLLHLVGDIHQPLHCSGRFSTQHSGGDHGGNLFQLGTKDKNLHALWDHALSTEQDPKKLAALAKSLIQKYEKDPVEVDIASGPVEEGAVMEWIEESATLARYFVYTVGDEKKTAPFLKPTTGYQTTAHAIAEHRVAIAGYRLAALLNDRLQESPE